MVYARLGDPMTVRPKIMKKRLKLAEELTRKNGGKLPNPWKMIQQGHGGLYRYVQRHPREFSHFKIEEAVGQELIKQNVQGTFNLAIRREHLKKARQLARKNKGVLQDSSWLMRQGYTRLASYIKTYPHIFACFNGRQKRGLVCTRKKRKHV